MSNHMSKRMSKRKSKHMVWGVWQTYELEEVLREKQRAAEEPKQGPTAVLDGCAAGGAEAVEACV